MPYTQEMLEELNMLTRYPLTSMQEGIKVHKSSAPKEVVEATSRLFLKGLVTQEDGGYLTSQGVEAAQHAQTLLDILKTAYA